MKTLVLILAAGPMGDEHYSWRHGTPRHLLPIRGEPLIRRTLRLIRRFGHDAVVVTKSDHIKRVCKNVFEPENDHLIYDTMLSTRDLWNAADRTVFIQADHLLYEDFLKTVFEDVESCNFEADHGPPAVAFARQDYGRCERGLRHLSEVHVLNQDCMQSIKGFVPRILRYRDKSLYDFDNTKIWNLCLKEQPWVSEKPKPVLLFLAAGRATRLKPVSDETPKALIEFGGVSLAEMMIDEFLKHGVVGEVVVSVGHFRGRVESRLGTERKGVPLTYVFNPDYKTTGAGTSVTAARGHIHNRQCFVFEGDQILHPELVRRLVLSPHLDCMLVDGNPSPGNDPGVAAAGEKGGLVEHVIWPAHKAKKRDYLGNAPFALKLSQGASEIFAGIEDDGNVEALNGVLASLPMYYVDTGDLPWAHINTLKGLDHAQNVVFPKIQKGIE